MRQFCPILLGIGGVALAFAVVAVATAPGIYSPDSLDQLLQAQRGVYSDGHPPLMAGLWSLLLRVSGTAATLVCSRPPLDCSRLHCDAPTCPALFGCWSRPPAVLPSLTLSASFGRMLGWLSVWRSASPASRCRVLLERGRSQRCSSCLWSASMRLASGTMQRPPCSRCSGSCCCPSSGGRDGVAAWAWPRSPSPGRLCCWREAVSSRTSSWMQSGSISSRRSSSTTWPASPLYRGLT